MLKKIMATGAICAIACGISYGKTGALDIMESSLKGVSNQGVEYYCSGNDAHATCYFKNTDTTLFGVSNMRADMWLTDSQIKQEISGNIDVSFFGGDYDDLLSPKSFKCESTSTLQDLQDFGSGSCTIKSDVATLSLNTKTLIESKSFRYKTMPSLVVSYIAQAERFSKDYDAIQTKYEDKLTALRKQTAKDKEEVQDQIDMLESASKKRGGCNYSKAQTISNEIKQKKTEKENIMKLYNDSYDAIQKQYEDEMQTFTQSVVSWLKQYNYTMQEARFDLHTNQLGEIAFSFFARHYLGFDNSAPLTMAEKQEFEKRKKEVSAQYYSRLGATRAAGMTFVGQSAYLDDHLRKSLKKVIEESAKLFDSNSHKSSLKILITPLSQDSVNLGDEAQRLISAYNKDGSEMLHVVFNIINRYDIRAVQWWPE